jgi:AmmeMemoRadiSam system protein A
MALTSSSDSITELSSEDRRVLLELAQASIEHGVHGQKLHIKPADYSQNLQRQGASFVTIKVTQELRGCIGSIEAQRMLVVDVVRNAHAAAFSDPRFPPLTAAELNGLDVHISVLSAPQTVACTSEADLIGQLRPGIDGVIIEEGGCRATYLPGVWEVLPDPQEFMRQLKCKAGLPADYWSERIRVKRYRVEDIP